MRKYNPEDSLQPSFICVIYLVLNQKFIVYLYSHSTFGMTCL